MATHNFAIKHYLLILWWMITLRGYKVAIFYYYDRIGMVDLYALRAAQKSNKKEYELLKPELDKLLNKEKETTPEE